MGAVYLVRVRGPQERDRWALEPGREHLVGRLGPAKGALDVDLWPDLDVSRIHARIWFDDDVWWIEDLGSTNGTLVGGREIKGMGPMPLALGIEIQMGETALRFGPEQPEGPGLHDTMFELDLEAVGARVADPTRPSAAPQDGAPDDQVAQAERHLKAFYELGEVLRTAGSSEGPLENLVDLLEPGVEIRVGDNVLMLALPDLERSQPSNALVELEAEGQISTLVDATIPPFAMPGPGALNDRLAQAQRRLRVFYDFSEALGTAGSPERLLQILVEQVQRAIPAAQRGAVVLRDERGELLLKAHWPRGEPSMSTTWVERACANREAFIWAAPDDESGDLSLSVIRYHVQSAIYVPLVSGREVLGLVYVDNHDAREVFTPTDLELLRAIANQAAMFIKNHALQQDLLREEVVRSNLLRQFSHKIADRLLKERGRLRLGGERAEPVTVLVSDVRGFTALSATMPPDAVVQMLNEMFGVFIPIVFEHDGTVDKYVGDAMLAVFGSPEPDDRQWEKAVRAALEMQQAMQKLEDVWRMRGLPVCQIGIGIHTGAVVHGFVGSADRMEYTIIGDTVNRASRYCDGAGRGEVLISKAVYEHVYRMVEVLPKIIQTKHRETEPDLEAYVVTRLKGAPA